MGKASNRRNAKRHKALKRGATIGPIDEAAVYELYGRPVSDETIYAVLGILGTYILGQGIADAGAAKAAITSKVDVADAVADAIDGASER